MGLKNLTPDDSAYYWHSKWFWRIAIKIKRTRIHFLSEICAVGPSSDLKGTEKTGNKTVQLVVEHCCKSIVARFNSPGTNQVCVKTDFWLRGSRAIDDSYVTCCKTSLSWAGKTHNRAKSGTTLQHLFSTSNNTICWRTGVKVGGKTRNIAIQLVSQQCYKTSCTFLLPVLSYL